MKMKTLAAMAVTATMAAAPRIVECETGYNTEKGVECYEATKGEGALIYQPLSTGITYQIIPKAMADGIPIHTMG